MKRTDGKLAEATFFLEKIREYYDQSPDIGYYANAFISAARSVTWVLQAECADISGWPEWYDAKSATEEEEKFFKKMNAARIRSQKRESIALRNIVTIAVPVLDKDEISSSEKIPGDKGRRTKTMKIPLVPAGPGKAYIRPDLTQATKELEEFHGEDVVEVAARYLEILSELVEECRARFFA